MIKERNEESNNKVVRQQTKNVAERIYRIYSNRSRRPSITYFRFKFPKVSSSVILEYIRARAKEFWQSINFDLKQPNFKEFLKFRSFRSLGEALTVRLVLESNSI